MNHVYGDKDAIAAGIGAALAAAWTEGRKSTPNATPDELVNALVETLVNGPLLKPVDDNASDGFHTVGDLYDHRMVNNAMWMQWAHEIGGFDVHKSRAHHYDSDPIYPGFFIVVAQFPEGQISYHYPIADWDLFQIPERDRPAPYDDHSPRQSLARMKSWLLEGV